MRVRVAAPLALSLMLSLAMGNSLAADAYTPPTSDTFIRAIKRYPFVAPAARREKIRLGVPALTRCMASRELRNVIGDPDCGYVAYKAGTEGRVPSMLIWNYVLEKKAALETEPGSRVVVWLDTNGRLQAVTVHGAPDIEPAISRRAQSCT